MPGPVQRTTLAPYLSSTPALIIPADSRRVSLHEQTHPHRRRWTGRLGSSLAMRPAQHRSRAVRDAAGALDAGAPDRELCRTGVLQLVEVRHRKHRALAAERGDAPRRFAADPDRA